VRPSFAVAGWHFARDPHAEQSAVAKRTWSDRITASLCAGHRTTPAARSMAKSVFT